METIIETTAGGAASISGLADYPYTARHAGGCVVGDEPDYTSRAADWLEDIASRITGAEKKRKGNDDGE